MKLELRKKNGRTNVAEALRKEWNTLIDRRRKRTNEEKG